MSLWTPTGERAPRSETPKNTPSGGAFDDEEMDEEQARAAVEELRRQLAKTPAAVVIANHAYGLFELAAVYLSEVPPRLADAQLAIDCLGNLLDGAGERLGDAGTQLNEALAQVRLGFVQVAAAEKARESSN